MDRQTIIEIAAGIVPAIGLNELTRNDVAVACDCAPSLINYHFDTFARLKACIVRYAIRHEKLDVLAMAIAAKHPDVKFISNKVRGRALKLLAAV